MGCLIAGYHGSHVWGCCMGFVVAWGSSADVHSQADGDKPNWRDLVGSSSPTGTGGWQALLGSSSPTGTGGWKALVGSSAPTEVWSWAAGEQPLPVSQDTSKARGVLPTTPIRLPPTQSSGSMGTYGAHTERAGHLCISPAFPHLPCLNGISPAYPSHADAVRRGCADAMEGAIEAKGETVSKQDTPSFRDLVGTASPTADYSLARIIGSASPTSDWRKLIGTSAPTKMWTAAPTEDWHKLLGTSAPTVDWRNLVVRSPPPTLTLRYHSRTLRLRTPLPE